MLRAAWLLSFAAQLLVQSSRAAPYKPPAGGIGTNSSSPPQYVPMSDFDFQSLNLALNQEYIELDLFHYGLARFSPEEFDAAGIDAEDRYLIQFMADQEVGHAIAISNMLGLDKAAKPCTYTYPFQSVKEFVDFSQKLTRWGESGVYGFLEHLNSRAAAQILLQSITVEARQQVIFRQFEGLFAMPEWHIPGITQSMAWTLLSPYLVSCPEDNPRIKWQIFPTLNITNNPSVLGLGIQADITNNLTQLSNPGRELQLAWEAPGKNTSYNNSYVTETSAGAAKFVAWISQLNTTYTPLENITESEFGWTGTTIQPGASLYPPDQYGKTIGVVNSTIFVLITDDDPFLTPFNVSLLNPHVVAGPAIYQSG